MARNYMLLYGRNSIWERLKANPQSIRKLILQDNAALPYIEKLIKEHNIPWERASSRELSRLKPAKDLQGIVAKVDQFAYTPFEDLLSQSARKPRTLIFLDRINDPQNLGVIIRNAACFGQFAVVIPRFSACCVTEAVLHVASGGENYVPVSLVNNLSPAVIAAKRQGYWIIGGVISDDAESIDNISFSFPLALVLGSEGEGIRFGLQKYLDRKVSIPMQGAKLSFNVAIACAIFCYEVAKQRTVSE